MPSGLLQMQFKGPQDLYLIGNPSITYFRNVYRKYSNFSIDTQTLSFNNKVEFGKTCTCNIVNYGDLINQIYLYIKLPELVSSDNLEGWKGYINNIGYNIIKTIQVEIGGNIIDTHSSVWLDIYNELFDQKSDDLINKYNTDIILQNNSSAQELYIPLKFWFNRSIGNSLPIIGMENQDIKINIEFRKLNELIKSDNIDFVPNSSELDCNLLVNYIHLDASEKKIFKNKEHEYVIEQVQSLSDVAIKNNNNNIKVPLDFSQPIKQIFWVISDNINNTQNVLTGNNWLSYTSVYSSYGDTFNTAKISIDGNDRTDYHKAFYYRYIVPYEKGLYYPRKYIYTYSFSIYPDNDQPSGSCNYSKITKSYLNLTFNKSNTDGGATNGVVRVFGTNYNVLKVAKGTAGLLFMN